MHPLYKYIFHVANIWLHKFYKHSHSTAGVCNETVRDTDIQGDADSISVIKKKKGPMNMCLIPNGYWDRVVWISRPKSVRFLFGGLEEQQSLQKIGGYMRQIAGSHFGCCTHKEMRRSTPTNYMQSLHMSCKVYWGWQWNFLTFFVNCNTWHFCVTNLSLKH
jgi:hypothetical protein